MEKDPLSESDNHSCDFTYQAIMDSGVSARYMAQASTSDDDLMDISGTSAGGGREGGPGAGQEGGDTTQDLDAIPGLGQYDDFHTIDWQRDQNRDRHRHRHIVKRKGDSLLGLIKGAHDAWSGWVCVLLVGLTSGVMAGIIDIGATWLTDLKFGICPSAFYLNMEQCCWSSNETVRDISGNCSLWLTWSELLGAGRDTTGGFLLRYISYVVWALIFASLAASLVRSGGGEIPPVLRYICTSVQG